MTVYITDSIKQSFIQSLKTLISYPSVLQEGENGTPFGQAIQDVLEKTLEICRELGLKLILIPRVIMVMQRLVRENSLPSSATWMLCLQEICQIGNLLHLKQLSEKANSMDEGHKTTKVLHSQLSTQ